MEFEVDKVIRRARRKRLWTPKETTVDVDLGRAEIERILPHRPPMLFVDHISAVDLAQEAACGTRTLNPEDPIFGGHFPDHPIYPGALLVETMGQLAICLHHLLIHDRVNVLPEDTPPPVRLLRLQHAVFLAEASPGDELTLLNVRLDADAYTMVCAAQALKGEEIVCAAVMEVFLPGDDD